MSSLPFVSVIVPSFNEEKHIEDCLNALAQLNYPKDRYEIIIVDNGSTDATISIASKFTQHIYIYPGITVGALRNFGVKKANGGIYAFIDADCNADKDWLINAVVKLNKEHCVTGSKYAVPDHGTWIEKAWFSQTLQGRHKVLYINSGNLFVPTNIFKIVGGFDESLQTGEDYEFCQRAGKITKIISDSSIKVTHLGNPKTVMSFLTREIWHGLGSVGSLKHNWLDKPFIGTLAFLIFSITQIGGLIHFIATNTIWVFLLASVCLITLILMTVCWRYKYINSALLFLQLSILYYLYYLGRTISLFLLINRQNFQRKK